MVKVHEVRHEYEKQSQVYASIIFNVIILVKLLFLVRMASKITLVHLQKSGTGRRVGCFETS